MQNVIHGSIFGVSPKENIVIHSVHPQKCHKIKEEMAEVACRIMLSIQSIL